MFWKATRSFHSWVDLTECNNTLVTRTPTLRNAFFTLWKKVMRETSSFLCVCEVSLSCNFYLSTLIRGLTEYLSWYSPILVSFQRIFQWHPGIKMALQWASTEKHVQKSLRRAQPVVPFYGPQAAMVKLSNCTGLGPSLAGNGSWQSRFQVLHRGLRGTQQPLILTP